MKARLALAPAVFVLGAYQVSSAATHRTPRAAVEPAKTAPRSEGWHIVPHPEMPPGVAGNAPHEVIVHDPKTKKDEHHQVIIDRRPSHVIDQDPHLRVIVRGYKPGHDWTRFHRAHGAWWKAWGITSWADVGTVTCEAANETSGALYPVSEDRDARGWDDATVNTILDQALDDCMAEAAPGEECGPVVTPCTFQPY
ncbi:MAG TPA: hypothetical protein VLX92_15245 [Kofleriaceae bacterium]|nr:hypothetical protein [Kofleriaceae bacterium]